MATKSSAKSGTKVLPSGVKCYQRYNNAGYTYTICDTPFKAGSAKVKAPPRGPFSAYYRGENSKGQVASYYQAPQVDPSDFLLSIGKNYRDLTPSQQNEYQRLDKAMRRSKQFSAISSGVGGKEQFTEYMKQSRQDKIEETALRNEQKNLQKGKDKLRKRYEKKGVTLASTEKEITEYFDDRLERETSRLTDKDRIASNNNNRYEQQEINVRGQIKEATDDIVNYVNKYSDGELWKVPLNKYAPYIQEFLDKSGLKNNDMVRVNIFRNREKPITEATSLYKNIMSALFKTNDPDKQKKLIGQIKSSEQQKKFRERISKILPKTPFHAEDKVSKDQLDNYKIIIDGAKQQYEAGALGQFKENFPKFLEANNKATQVGELKRLKEKRDSDIARAKIQLKLAKKDAGEKGKENTWIKKYVKLIFDTESTINNIDKAQGQGIDIPVLQQTNLKEILTSSSQLIEDIIKIENKIDKIDKKENKVKSDYEEALEALKTKKEKTTRLSKRTADLDKLDKEKANLLKEQLKDELTIAKMNKKHSEVANVIKKEIKQQAGKSQQNIDTILKNINKEISKAEKGVPPPIPENKKGKKLKEEDKEIKKLPKKQQKELDADEEAIKKLKAKIAKKKKLKADKKKDKK